MEEIGFAELVNVAFTEVLDDTGFAELVDVALVEVADDDFDELVEAVLTLDEEEAERQLLS